MTQNIRIALATITATLLLTVQTASDQSEMVEVAMTIEFAGDSIQPVVLMEVGRTVDIQVACDPDYGQADRPQKIYGEAPADADPRRDHRVLLTVDSLGDAGYLAKTEYMSRPDGKWVSQWQPMMAVNADIEASMELEAEDGQMSRLAITVLPSRDLGSWEDAEESRFHSAGQGCHVASSVVTRSVP